MRTFYCERIVWSSNLTSCHRLQWMFFCCCWIKMTELLFPGLSVSVHTDVNLNLTFLLLCSMFSRMFTTEIIINKVYDFFSLFNKKMQKVCFYFAFIIEPKLLWLESTSWHWWTQTGLQSGLQDWSSIISSVSFQLRFIICTRLYEKIIFKWRLYLRDACE